MMSIPDKTKELTLPEGFTARPAKLQDIEAVVALFNDENLAKGHASTLNSEDILNGWQESDFNLEESSLIIENSSGTVIAYTALWDTSANPVRPWGSWSMYDDYYETELAHYVLNWLEQKAQRVIEKCPADAKITLRSNALEGYDNRIGLLETAGFVHSRNFYRMSIEMDEAPPQAILPDTIEIRTLRYPDEIEAMAIALEAGFKDHYGFVEEPIEQEIKFWTHFLATDTLFDPELYFLAVDKNSGEIAGLALCRIEQVGMPETAYVEELAVVPDYRRQGVALALLHHAFGELYKRGRDKVALHVDAESLTGATRLYAKAGMTPVETWMHFEKVIRDGVELAKMELD